MGNDATSIDESIETGARDPYSLSVMIIFWIVGVPVIILSVFLIITLIGQGQLPKSIRIVLINIQAAVIVFAVMRLIAATLFIVEYDCFREVQSLMEHSSNYTNGTIQFNQSDVNKCRAINSNIRISFNVLLLYVYPTMVSIRLVFMTFYGILVYIYIRYVFYKIKIWAVVVSCVAVWIIFILINIPVLGLIVLRPDSINHLYINLITAVCWGFAIPLVVAVPAITFSIILPIRALFFINNCTREVRNVSYGKAITKMVLFQLIVNVISIIGHIIVFIPVIVFTEALTQGRANDPLIAILMGFLLEMTSLMVSPILFIIFLKHVRENAKKIFNCKCFNFKGSST